MLSKYSYDEAKAALLAALARDVLLHESGRFGDLGEPYDEIDARLPRNTDPRFNKLHFAHEFWAGWLDAREHDWMYYEPIKQPDWPSYAKRIIADLEAERETTDPTLTKHFAPRPGSRSLLAWIVELFRGKQS